MRRNIKLVILVITLLITLFTTSYYTNKILETNASKDDLENNATLASQKDILNDKINISLSKGSVNEENKSLAQLKDELGIKGEITEEVLTTALSQKGYTLTQANQNILYYNRTVAPNKYYIMQYEDGLAIYKSDSNCKLNIENQEQDIYNEGKKYSHLTAVDRQKMDNYEMEYNSKGEAEQAITELIS